ncbi:hypothetical protein AGR4A_Cc40173 [Agrobacterium tumefaciens str. B6]|uniref:Uncharacterized protein n=1 Tax=Agrobacterium tumefaciens str. B6 TaxID=1183423 RepID=A0A822V3U1_AGRTU|nr:hypothetical protein AGR4A_Cc40173 [Agrobacterium tumefaciens str. B6]
MTTNGLMRLKQKCRAQTRHFYVLQHVPHTFGVILGLDPPTSSAGNGSRLKGENDGGEYQHVRK